MRFHSADHGEGRVHHRNIALTATLAFPSPPADGIAPATAFGHVAMALPRHPARLKRLGFPRRRGARQGRRAARGMTRSRGVRDPSGHSVGLPRKVRDGDLDAALDHAVALPTERDGAPRNSTKSLPAFASSMEDC